MDSGDALLALPASKGAKLKNAGESMVVSDSTARALLAFLCRGCSPLDRVFRLSFKGLASALVTAAAVLGSGRGYFPLRSFWVRRFNDPLWALGAARKYISQAACDAGGLSLPIEGRRRARRCAALLSHLALDLQV